MLEGMIVLGGTVGLAGLIIGAVLLIPSKTRSQGREIVTYSGAAVAFALGYGVIASGADEHGEAELSKATAATDARMWVIADAVERRTCPSEKCGVVGKLFYREAADVVETRNGWARVSRYYYASCFDGSSDYVDYGPAECVPENGIEHGEFAEWIRLDLLAEERPVDPGVGATGTAKLIAQSDDFRHYEKEFVDAAETLMRSGQCIGGDFEEIGGWYRSVNKGQGIYFTYCGGGTDRIYLDVSTGRIFR